MSSNLSSIKNKLCTDSLVAGETICYPTEGVWGLGCDPFHLEAVDHILWLKRRPWEKGLILVAASIEQFDFLLEGLEYKNVDRMKKSWPGPSTWLVPHRNLLPPVVTGGSSKVAIRVSAHPTIIDICQGFGGPMVSTSANTSGATAAIEKYQALRYFGQSGIRFAAGRVTQPGKTSTITDLETGKQLR